jgi:hypothetical protein
MTAVERRDYIERVRSSVAEWERRGGVELVHERQGPLVIPVSPVNEVHAVPD